MNKEISTNNAPSAVGPYSQAVEAGDFIYVSGQLGLNPADGSLAPDVVEQARQSLKNIGEILKASGCDYSNVVKTSVFITDLSAFAAVNEVYATFFSKPYPARSCVEVSKLPKGGLVEIECIAKSKFLC